MTKKLAVYDSGNRYAVNYMWGTTGIGYNVKAVQRILGPDGKIDSWNSIFDPDKLAKFKDCGIQMLDSADDILPPRSTFWASIRIQQKERSRTGGGSRQ